MIKALLISVFALSGCTTGTFRSYEIGGKEVTMPLFLQPLCLLFCNAGVSNTAAQSRGSTGALSTSSTQTVEQTKGTSSGQ